jgi:hypothetical protein
MRPCRTVIHAIGTQNRLEGSGILCGAWAGASRLEVQGDASERDHVMAAINSAQALSADEIPYFTPEAEQAVQTEVGAAADIGTCCNPTPVLRNRAKSRFHRPLNRAAQGKSQMCGTPFTR